MKKLRITERVCELSSTTELNVVEIIPEEGNIITDSRIYGKDKQEIHRFNLRNFTQLIRTGWYELRIAANCTITYNLIDQD
jgi:hypothetical protein